MQEIGSVTIGLEALVFDTEFADLDTPLRLEWRVLILHFFINAPVGAFWDV